MAAGIQPTVAQINANAGAIALNLRQAFGQVVNFQAWLTTQNSASLIALGFSAGDAATLISTIGNLNTLAGIYSGAAAAGFNYQANSYALWGGQ